MTAVETAWQGTDSPVCREVVEQARANLAAYRVNPPLLEEQRNIEDAAAEGGYQGRQLYELVQNGADALLADPGGALHVVLSDHAFYCANEGDPIDVDGVRAILLSNVSRKRGAEIGRFGLGFKSVLEVTDDPEFYSRSGSFAWNYERTLAEISSAVPGFGGGRDAAPRLRLAWPVDPQLAFAEDAILAQLAEWATTIVKLPLRPDTCERLADDVNGFPAEFLLFCRHVGRLTLENRSSQAADPQTSTDRMLREITMSVDDDVFTVREGTEERPWVLFSLVHSPSEAAKEDAGVMSRRDRVPIDWALPLDDRPTTGVLWTFFPTDFETTLSGIVNAPWKTNPDRRNLLEGTFNRELLGVVAKMVVDNLPRVHKRDDPGRILDIIPARGRGAELRGWEDRVLNEEIYRLAAFARSLPNVDGELCYPAELTLAPTLRRQRDDGGETAQRLLALWTEVSPDRAWCHPSTDTRDRRSRAERLISEGGGSVADFTAWLEAPALDGGVEGSAGAITIAAELITEGLAPPHEIDRARIILTTDGRLVQPDPDEVYLESDYEAADEEIAYVARELADDPAVRSALAGLGIEAIDAAADLEASLRTGFSTWTDDEWVRFWEIVRRVGVDRAAGTLRSRRRIPFVRTRAGEFRPLRSTLLPGAVVPEEGTRDRNVLVDIDFHAHDLELLAELGLRAGPEPGLGSTDEPWFDHYRALTLIEYHAHLPGRRRPQERLLGFLERKPFAGPLSALDGLSQEGRAVFTEAALAVEGPASEDWLFGHTTQPDSYPKRPVEPPLIWRIRQEGRLRTSLGIRSPAVCAAPALAEWKQVLPVYEGSDELAVRLRLPDSLDDLSDAHWEEALRGAEQAADDNVIGRLYVAAASRIDAPAMVRCRVGATHVLEPPEQVTVVYREQEVAALQAEGIPVILAPSRADAEALRERWGMNGETVVTTTVAYGDSSAPVALVDKFPALELQIPPEDRTLTLVACRELRLETNTAGGRLSDDIELYRQDGTIYYRDDLEDADLLLRLSTVTGAELDESAAADVLRRGVDLARRERRRLVREKPTLQARVVEALGVDAIRARLPKGLLNTLDAAGGTSDETTYGELALAVYGVDVLRTFRTELHDSGLEPPQTWAGSTAALSFVRKLGFPREFAGFQHGGRSPLLEVEGPPQVPPLHDYQRVIADEFRKLLRNEFDRKRAILSLPTGAGKTRVAVDALIEAVQHDGLDGPILWVAQSDELCEQAVQTWSFVWRGLGEPRAKLTISRLWASNEAEPVEGTHVVVATVAKLLAGCTSNPDYSWLAEAACVVIDEAHHSVGPGYTEIIHWLGFQRGRDPRPLVGLTATPFRGTSSEETQRLVDRYGALRLDTAAFGPEDPYPLLQVQGILASVRHRVLGGVDDFVLTADELRMLERTRLFPRTAEERLGLDSDRNRRLLEEIAALPPDWTILLYATSVDHAQTMAALLTLQGISAKPITGLTQPGPRRHYIEQFRNGDLRVLTNYAVLTQGFDAPAVRAIFVARPTYSPNLYQQMIGRGLRGVENGGKDECLIVNVEDTVREFGRRLAFREFEHLWTASGNAA